MENEKPKSIKNLEEKMDQLDSGSLRYHILESAKNFKRSWIELGRALYSVWKDKTYKEWGYQEFDVYTQREIGIRKQTAMKLLKSYYFLEKEEPQYLKDDYSQENSPAQIPSYESIDVLRQAKQKKNLDKQDYQALKEQVFEKGRPAQEVKKDLTSLIRQREELAPEEAHEKRRLVTLRRLLGSLKSVKQEAQLLKFLNAPILRELESLIVKIEEQINN